MKNVLIKVVKVVKFIVVIRFLLIKCKIIYVLVSKNIIFVICLIICDMVEGFIEWNFWKYFWSKFIIGIISNVKFIVWIIVVIFLIFVLLLIFCIFVSIGVKIYIIKKLIIFVNIIKYVFDLYNCWFKVYLFNELYFEIYLVIVKGILVVVIFKKIW